MKYSLSAKNLVCRNLETKAGYFAGLANPNQTKEITGLLRTDSGLLSSHFNQVISNSVVQPRILQRFVVDYFAERHSPFSLWHCASKPLDDVALGELHLLRQPPLIAMAAEVKQLAPNDKPDDKLKIKNVTRAEDVIAYGDLIAASQSCNLEAAQTKKFYKHLSELPEHKYSRLKMHIGEFEGKAVATGCLFSSADALGFYDLWTLPEYRAHGVGSAMFQQMVREVLNSHHKHAVALVGEDQQDLWLDTGFYAVGEVTSYEFTPERGASSLHQDAPNDDASDDRESA
ncbi:GNAT family N-acetyltransferase [Microbulbifer agarilyticus]|uniref:GNAT family N-acetyltransferase n=1 Tax=Microbulbifer agarilyticus TaxID=260552 RepID=UPI001C95C2AA|nr:GNAT family N-acetyltransferase [Microbulbifer agarilyticus]MBY6191170.1 GNAT family N-acetyltransferase [Microbulbifer agarilyticus]MBY6211771.1 GNAT family N-acetyltransferase [Microbulbifer agarilyticus]MCA0893204.1 GNAT family N-acetyltransferase [Microbulbifer agarilyticus]